MRCLVVLACLCAVVYARAQSSVDTSELKTNAEIPEAEPIEEPITDIKSSSSPIQVIQSDEANIKTNENESNISSNDEELAVAPTNSAPSVIVPKPDESKNSAYQDIQSDEANLKTNENESNINSNYEELPVAPTNSAPSVIVPKPDESKNSVNQNIQSDKANIKTSENESNISSNDEELDVAPTNSVPSIIVPKPDESSGKDEDLDIAPTNLAPIIVADLDESSDSVNDEDLEVSPTNLAPSVSDRQGRYKALPDQYNEESAPRSAGKLICKEKNERYSVPGSCDKYVECLNGTAEEKQCPDGLRYNPNVLFNVYPCQYPIDVPCLGRSALQPAQPTADCPHQFGYFKTGDTRNCSGFRNCVNGVGYDFTCPEGLAFSTDTYRCEWPDQVPKEDCDAEAFLGFRCPEVPTTKELGPPAGFRFYRSPSDCQVYFICIDGKPRRLACGGYSAFDDLSETCVNAEDVSACPQELKTRAAQAKEKEERRQRLLAENPLKSGKSRYTAEEFPTNVPTYAEPEPTQNLAQEGDVETLVPKFPTNVPTYAVPRPTQNLAEEGDVENLVPKFPTNVPTYAVPRPTQNLAEEGDVENLVPKFPTNVPTYAVPRPTQNLAEEGDVENVVPTLLSELEE